MKKTLSLLFILSLGASCTSQNIANPDFSLNNEQTNISSSSQEQVVAKLIENNRTIVNKNEAIKKLTNNSITLENTAMIGTDDIYTITFSQGSRPNGVIGQLGLFVKKNGTSKMQMFGNYHNNIAVSLNVEETKKLLQSASNYDKYKDKLGKLFK